MARATVLVIDDDKHLVEVIQEYLEAQGYTVFTALDGVHAHSMACTRKPAVIILDVDMPITNGLQALEQLRKDPRTKDIPVILLTGVVSAKVFPAVQNLPRVSHVKKPVHLEDLASMVRHYIPEDV